MSRLKELQNTDLGRFWSDYEEVHGWATTEYRYDYRDGTEAFTIWRADKPGEKKVIRPFGPIGEAGYPKGDANRSRPLYNLRRVLAKNSGERVIVVEGEKCVEAAERVFPRSVVVTWAGGSKAIDKTDWQPLEIDEVLLIADADEPGRNAMRKIAAKLKKLHCTVRLYLPDFDNFTDIFDWAEGKDKDGLAKLAAEIEAETGQGVSRSVGEASGASVVV